MVGESLDCMSQSGSLGSSSGEIWLIPGGLLRIFKDEVVEGGVRGVNPPLLSQRATCDVM